MVKSLYFLFSYPMVVFAWLLVASVANSAVKGKELYRCVVIDPSIAGKDQPIEKNTRVFYQEAGSNEAQYVGKTATLDFDFKEVPMKVKVDKSNDLSESRGTPTRFHGYDEKADIEVNCDKKLRK